MCCKLKIETTTTHCKTKNAVCKHQKALKKRTSEQCLKCFKNKSMTFTSRDTIYTHNNNLTCEHIDTVPMTESREKKDREE